MIDRTADQRTAISAPTAPELAAEIRRLEDKYDDLPREVMLKEALLTQGMAFTTEALRYAAEFKRKSYFIFSFDRVPIEELDNEENLRAPEEIRFSGGPNGYRSTCVSVRVNPHSPLTIDLDGDRLVMRLEGDEAIAEIELLANPEYYQKNLASGQPVHEVAPTIEWGYLIYITVYRKCQYFGFKEECRFCDINENFRQQVNAGRPYRTVKPLDEVLEALDIIAATDTASKAYTLTGGSITRHLKGENEAEFYTKYARAIEERYPGRWIGKMVTQALPDEDQRMIKDSGITIYHPNYEVWDPQLFDKICPGKAAYVGRDEWIRRILRAADVFGPENVIPNFVAGVEMARPHGFTEVEDALKSTGEGLEYFMSQGVAPRFTTWCPEPLAAYGAEAGPAPLEYHVGLLRVWRDTHRRHGLPVPPGYGQPGVGNAVFSVSSFMDVIEVDA